MKVFITGGSGYLGRATIRALVAEGHDVLALARSESAAHVIAELGATTVQGELRDLDVLRAAAAQADASIQLAQEWSESGAQLDRAAAGAMLEGGGDSPYVHTGGTWMWGNTGAVVDESAPWAPPTWLAWLVENHRYVLEHAAHPVFVLPGVVWGHRGGLLESLFVTPARSRGVVHYIGDGTGHCALAHVDDIARLYVAALRAPAGSTYAGVGDERPTYRELAESLSQAAGCPGRIESITLDQARTELGPVADAFVLDQQLSSARAHAELGWTPTPRDVLADLAAGR
ncbi:MAG TPA: SDR family NAD(P)-dependent oxidoreductase [Jatrophihabitantaceae bacterium]|jgi:nucleoside-diphosphate-sugar epimerase